MSLYFIRIYVFPVFLSRQARFRKTCKYINFKIDSVTKAVTKKKKRKKKTSVTKIKVISLFTFPFLFRLTLDIWAAIFILFLYKFLSLDFFFCFHAFSFIKWIQTPPYLFEMESLYSILFSGKHYFYSSKLLNKYKKTLQPSQIQIVCNIFFYCYISVE